MTWLLSLALSLCRALRLMRRHQPPQRLRDDLPVAADRRAAKQRAHDAPAESPAHIGAMLVAIEQIAGLHDDARARFGQDQISVVPHADLSILREAEALRRIPRRQRRDA